MKHWTSDAKIIYDDETPQQMRSPGIEDDATDTPEADPIVQSLIAKNQVQRVAYVTVKESAERDIDEDDGKTVLYPAPTINLRTTGFLKESETAERVVVLLFQRGRYTWVFRKLNELRGNADANPDEIEIELASEALIEQLKHQERRRGLRDPVKDIVSWLVDGTKAYILKLAASATVQGLVDYLDGHIQPGIVPIYLGAQEGIQSPETWETSPDWHQRIEMPKDRPPRVLLLIHGTFSSTEGSFGALRPDFIPHAAADQNGLRPHLGLQSRHVSEKPPRKRE